jgi:hypothetical protein
MIRADYLPRACEFARRGNECTNAKLNPDRVRQIRENRYGWTTKRFAKEFGCHYRTIEKVQYFETWTHV